MRKRETPHVLNELNETQWCWMFPRYCYAISRARHESVFFCRILPSEC